MASLSSLGMMKVMPMITSKIPKKTIKVSGAIKGIVRSRSDTTIGPAGLVSIIFRNPNQKKTKNKANLAIGKEILRRKFMMFASTRSRVFLNIQF